MAVPYTFASATTSIPLANLDANFNYFAAQIYVSGSNVGIGASSPGAKLDVAGNLILSGQSTADQYLRIGSGRTGNGYSYLDLQGDTTYANGLRLIRLNTGANAGSNIESSGTGAFSFVTQQAADFVFFTNGSAEKLRILSGGNIGIGMPTPPTKLTVQGAKSNTDLASSGHILIKDAAAYNASPASCLQFGVIYNSSGSFAYGSSIQGIKENSTDGNFAQGIIFTTQANADSPREKMRILGAGNVLINVTSAGLGGLFEVNGAVAGYSDVRYPYIGSAAGTALVIDGSGYFRASSSSIRYKENVEPIDVGLDLILSLNPVKYDLKNGSIPQVGFIAEDFPDERLVGKSKVNPIDPNSEDQIESVNYANFTAVLTKAIQELNAKMELQAIEIEELKGKL